MAFVPMIASGSTNGRPIEVLATATPGTLIHTATAVADVLDEITLYAVGSSATARLLTIELGGVTAQDDLVEVTIPAQDGLHLVLPPHRMNNGVVVRAFAAAADEINIVADVTRITDIPA
jgi:hypothetical protein